MGKLCYVSPFQFNGIKVKISDFNKEFNKPYMYDVSKHWILPCVRYDFIAKVYRYRI